MIPINSEDAIREQLIKHYSEAPEERAVVALLFAPPDTEIGKNQIVPALPYFHHRTGKHFHVFAIGYGAYQPPDELPVITTIENAPWSFSAPAFNDLRELFEQHSRWRYSGEVDLVLTNVLAKSPEEVTLDPRNMIVLDVDRMIADGAARSARRLMEELCRILEPPANKQSAGSVSNRMGLRSAATVSVDSIVDMLPKAAGGLWKQTRHWRVISLG